MSERKVIPDSERHTPETLEEKLAIYACLHKIPPQPPCDACPWRKYPQKVQGCDNCGCGFMHIYMAEKYYQRAQGYWPFAGKEIESAYMLMADATELLDRIRLKGEKEG